MELEYSKTPGVHDIIVSLSYALPSEIFEKPVGSRAGSAARLMRCLFYRTNYMLIFECGAIDRQ